MFVRVWELNKDGKQSEVTRIHVRDRKVVCEPQVRWLAGIIGQPLPVPIPLHQKFGRIVDPLTSPEKFLELLPSRSSTFIRYELVKEETDDGNS